MAESAGILMYRRGEAGIEVLLVHPGGPFWRRRDLGAWSIPKGELAPDEEAEATARREFREELGCEPGGPLIALGTVRQRGGKRVTAFTVEGDFDPTTLASNSFIREWPPHSGRLASFPEVDRAAWFTLAEARDKINEGQRPLLDSLAELVAPPG